MLIRVLAMLIVLFCATPSLAADLTDRLQASRMTVLEVDKAAGTLRYIMHSSMSVGDAVIYAEGRQIGLGDLKAGDVIKVEPQAGSIRKIHTLRRAFDETASLER